MSISSAQQPTPPGKGYLGVYARSNSNVLDSSNAFAGVTVTRVIENSPADAAGLKENDIILQANGTDLSDPNQLAGIAESLPLGSEVSLRVERDREILELKATTVARVAAPESAPPDAPKTWSENRRLGFEFKTPDADQGGRLKLPARDGLVVVRIAPKSPLEKAKIAPGEVIASADGEPIHSPEAFLEYLKSRDAAKSIKLRVASEKGDWRNEKVRFYEPPKKVSKFNLPPLWLYKREASSTTFWIPLLLFKREGLANATKYRILWFIRFETGKSEELLEVEPI